MSKSMVRQCGCAGVGVLVLLVLDAGSLANPGELPAAYLAIREKLASTNQVIRLEGQSQAFAEGPNIVRAISNIATPEASVLTKNYQEMMNRGSAQKINAVIYFAKNGGVRLLARSLIALDLRDPYTKCAVIDELAKMPNAVVAPELPALITALETEPPSIAGSEVSTIHGIYIARLTKLVAGLLEMDVTSSVDEILKRGKAKMKSLDGPTNRLDMPAKRQ